MTGPYTAHIKVTGAGILFGGCDIELSAEDWSPLDELAGGFWQNGLSGSGTVLGAERGAALWAMQTLEPGEEARIEIHGMVAGKPALCRSILCRRDERGRIFTTLGSRFGERQFIFAGARTAPARGIGGLA